MDKIVTSIIKSNINGIQLQINCNATMTKLKGKKKPPNINAKRIYYVME